MRTPTADTPPNLDSQRAGPQSVGRIFAILDSVAGARAGASLSELARITDSPKTSLVGLLAGLTAEGCLVRDEAGRYFLGGRVHALAMQALAGRQLNELVRPVLIALAEASGETIVLCGLAEDADMAVYLDKVESASPIRYAVNVGERRELYCTAMGRVLLSGFTPARLKAYLKNTPRKKFTPSTVTGIDALTAEIARVRRDGIARSNEERIPGASALAAPILSGDGAVVAALMIAGPVARMQAHAAEHQKLLLKAAAECTRLAGGAPAAPEAGR